jgi:cytochrome c biogenesis protein CcdA
MHETCPQCGAKFEREPGFFLGSIYINYGITAVATLVGYLAMMFSNVPKEEWQRFAILISVAIILPLLLHRHARSLWLGFDQWQDPRPGEE